MKAELLSNAATAGISLRSTIFHPPSNSISGALTVSLSNLDGACIEKLLIHCANALESNDVTLAQQVMWVLNNVASPHGDPNQRLTSWLLSALLSRAARLCTTTMQFPGSRGLCSPRQMSVTELADYVDLTPWHRFGFCASNQAILSAVKGQPRIHIIDFSITHCMQWPTLIDALSKTPEASPALRITVPSARPTVPPSLTVSIEEVGLRLANFAKSRDVPFEFHVIKSDPDAPSFHQEFASLDIPSSLGLREDEVVVVNCQNWLRYLPETVGDGNYVTTRDGFLEMIKKLNPRIVTLTDEDADLDSASLTSRIMACFNYLWIPFDALETFLPKESRQRMEYEADVGMKMENIIGFEGAQRIERVESSNRVVDRMKRVGFLPLAFQEETVREVKGLLHEHSSGWGMKKEEEVLVLTWKGHNSVFTTCWVPNGLGE